MPRIGTDMIEIDRIVKNMLNPKFMERIYNKEELASLGENPLAESLAVRFAAKESVIKALGEFVPFADIMIFKEENGAPRLELKGKALEKANALGLNQWEVSLSHCRTHAIAMVMAMES